MITHDYTRRFWGHDLSWKTKDSGRTLDAMGWGYDIRTGDYLLLPKGERSTRYRVKEITYYRDPPDMWKATLVFDPRKVEA